jgi:integrase/recombinase XerD
LPTDSAFQPELAPDAVVRNPFAAVERSAGAVQSSRFRHAGEPLVLGYLTMLVATYVEASGVKKKGACHLWRHTMAMLMLEGGADIRFIQAMLGHVDLKSTDIYTHVAIRKLQEIHRATHPANLERDKRALLAAIAAEDDESNDDTL